MDPTQPSEVGPESGAEMPDPDFWGPEPRSVRRARRAAPPHIDSGRGFGAFVDTLRERFRDTRVEFGAGIVAIVVVALVAGLVWYRMSAGGAAPPLRSEASAAEAPRAPAAPAKSTTGTTRARGATVMVHVAGAVKTPGVFELPVGARVIDAVEGAGGGLVDADLDRLNLAAKLTDGQRVLVSKVGAPAVAAESGALGDSSATAVIDLNNATSAQLETLPGIGPSLAGAIISERERRGGFRSVNELREVRGIGEKRFADLRERVMV